jgi:hypothetical protein
MAAASASSEGGGVSQVAMSETELRILDELHQIASVTKGLKAEMDKLVKTTAPGGQCAAAAAVTVSFPGCSHITLPPHLLAVLGNRFLQRRDAVMCPETWP